MSREPQTIIIGPSFRNRQGEETVPMAFIHPCHVEGCDASAPFGYHNKWACRQHKGLLELLMHDAPGTKPEAPNVESNAHPDRLV